MVNEELLVKYNMVGICNNAVTNNIEQTSMIIWWIVNTVNGLTSASDVMLRFRINGSLESWYFKPLLEGDGGGVVDCSSTLFIANSLHALLILLCLQWF